MVTTPSTVITPVSEDVLNGEPRCEALHLNVTTGKSIGPCDGVAAFHLFIACTGLHKLVCGSFVAQLRGLPPRHNCGEILVVCYQVVRL